MSGSISIFIQHIYKPPKVIFIRAKALPSACKMLLYILFIFW